MTKKKPETKMPKRKTVDNVDVEDEMGPKVKKKKNKVVVSKEYAHQ